MPIQEVVKRHPLTSTKVHHRAKNKQFSTLRCTKTGSTQPKLSAACFVVQSCLADADFVVFSNYCLIGTRPKCFFFSWSGLRDSLGSLSRSPTRTRPPKQPPAVSLLRNGLFESRNPYKRKKEAPKLSAGKTVKSNFLEQA